MYNDVKTEKNENENENVPFYIGGVDNDRLIGLDTISTKNDGDLCVICYYDSDDEEDKNSETDQELSKETIHNTHRYCNLSYFEKDGTTANVCSHTFHTLCMYKWIKSSKKMVCPMCKQGHDEVIDEIPALIPKGPEYVAEYWNNGQKKIEYYKLNDEKNGLYKEYDRFGNLTLEREYKNNKVHGLELYYFRGTTIVQTSINYNMGYKDGACTKYTLKKKVLKQSFYNNDILHGPYKEYKELENGMCVKTIEAQYDNGKRQGKYYRWNKDGDVIKMANYLNGNKVHRYIKRHDDKTLNIALKMNYDRWGMRDGIYLKYFKDGTLKEKAYYTKGVMVKRHFEFFSNGNTSLYEEFDELGQLDGIKKEWHRNGKIKSYYHYDVEKLDGTCIRYNEQGKPIEICNYKNDMAHGTYVLNYYDGKTPKTTKEYRDGTLHGTTKDFNKNGQILREYNFKNGELQGKYLDYVNGIESNYQNGNLHGDFKKYSNGRLISTHTYNNGSMV